MSRLFALLQLLLVISICFYEFKRKSPAIFLWGTLLIMFSIGHFFSVLTKESNYPLWVLNYASVFVLYFSTLYFLTRVILVKLLLKSCRLKLNYYTAESHKSIKKQEQVFFILCISVVLIKALFFIKYTGGSILASSWGGMRGFIKETGTFIHIQNMLFFAFSGMLMYFIFKKPKSFHSILLLLLLFANVILFRNRIEILPILIAVVLFYSGKANNAKKVAVLAVLPFFIMYLVYALLVFRHIGTLSQFIEGFNLIEFNNDIFEYIASGTGELGLRNVFYYFIYHDNDFLNFGEGHTYLRILLMFFPTSMFSGVKPPDFALSMGYAVNPTILGFSTHPTLFGDCFANFGFYGVFVSLFWSLAVTLLDKMILKKEQLYKCLLLNAIACGYIIIARGSVYNGSFVIVYSLLTIYLIRMFMRIRIRNTSIV